MTCKNIFPLNIVPDTAREKLFERMTIKPDGCWEYSGSKNIWGYGCISIHGKNYQTHRVSWVIKNGPIPEGLFILHKCHKRDCINPDHLYVGDQKMNTNDRRKDGTMSVNRGESHPLSKLKYSDAEKIRELFSTGKVSQYALAKQFGVSRSCIAGLVQGRTWKYGDGEFKINPHGECGRPFKLTKELVEKIMELKNREGIGRYRIAKRVGISGASVMRVLNGSVFKRKYLWAPLGMNYDI